MIMIPAIPHDGPLPTSFELRRATETDLDALMSIERATFCDDAWDEEMMREDILAKNHYFIVVTILKTKVEEKEKEREIIGYADEKIGKKTICIESIAVVPEYRQQGVGTMLLKNLLEFASQHQSVTLVTLNVRVDNYNAQRMYERFGFKISKTRRAVYSDGVDSFFMKKILHASPSFCVNEKKRGAGKKKILTRRRNKRGEKTEQ